MQNPVCSSVKILQIFILSVLSSFYQDDSEHDVHFPSSLKEYLRSTFISMRVRSLGFYLFSFPKLFLLKQISAYSSLHFGFAQNSNSKLQSKPSPLPLLL